MKPAHAFELLVVVLTLAALYFFRECLIFLSAHDYVAAALVMTVGVAVTCFARELARYAIIARQTPRPRQPSSENE